ncbi:Uncharacterized protein dnm_049040 [Desulfonema magnum]|uniref:Uncharacterized protein n=1 Tax=Desulfonema magnum TaxID=45655 RepID=A0A975GPH5_9BACT|nr:Uncharacterized protein dnm_049040 [Desulfonema magnum]
MFHRGIRQSLGSKLPNSLSSGDFQSPASFLLFATGMLYKKRLPKTG